MRKYDGGIHTVRSGDFKWLHFAKKDTIQLYNLAEDIGEQNDISAENSEQMQSLSEMSAAWDSELIEPVFLGLIHTPQWQKKLRAQQKKKDK